MEKWGIYPEMKALGVKPNLVIYNILLDAMGRAKRPWQAKKIHQEMTSNGLSPSWEMKEKGMQLNVILFNTILAMCADCSDTNPDSWTFSSMITIYSCSGNVSEAEAMLNEMLEADFEPNIFTLTSFIQCYGKVKRIVDVVRTFNQLLELGNSPDERFCSCLLNVMTQTPKEELDKLIGCIDKANPKLGQVVKLADVKKAYYNYLIDLCVNLNLLEKAYQLLDLGLTQKSLNLKGLSLVATLTALHVWINDLSKVLESGGEFPPLLGINTGHGKHKYSNKGLASIFESHLKELNAPFHEAPNKAGWFLTTKVAAKSWLESRSSSELVAA
ncbi:hypothetical protein UlMin_038565 [Ulmus minor]